MAARIFDLRLLACLVLGSGFLATVSAFDNTRKDNLAIYWGQDGANTQQPLAFYCDDDTVDVIPLAFLYIFRGKGGDPVIDFANTCNQWDDTVFSGTALADCTAAMSKDIQSCQSKGKLITLSLGGGTGQVGFSSDSQAQTFATQVWNMFLGGTSSTRPFGNVVLDGLDLDIESGTPAHYAAFVNQIRSLAAPTGKNYYITAAPQCPFPDAYIGAALNQASFDAVYVQFYNNYCGLDQPSEYNFATWDNWAKTTSFNKNVKVYIGAPGSPDAAGTGYVNSSTLAQYVLDAQSKYSSFGGVMMWDMDTAYSNKRFDLSVKNGMVESAVKLGFPPRKPASASSSVTVVHTTQEPASATPKSAPSASHSAATSSVRPTTASLHTSAVETSIATSNVHPTTVSVHTPAAKASVATVVPQPITATVEPEPVASSPPHRHVFRPHQTINAAASIALEKWEHELASFKGKFRPSSTDTPAQAMNVPQFAKRVV